MYELQHMGLVFLGAGKKPSVVLLVLTEADVPHCTSFGGVLVQGCQQDPEALADPKWV